MEAKVGFSWVTPILCVTNMLDSLDYYQQKLGFEVAWKWSEEEAFEKAPHPTFCCVCRGEISLFLCENGQGNPGSWLMLNVSSKTELDSLFDEYQKSKVDIVEPPQDYSWGMREMAVRDLDGNILRIGCGIDSERNGDQ